jgi:transcriptional regulator GlxA family with amidase domain
LEEASGAVGGLAEYQRLLPGIDYMQRHYREDPPLAAIAHAAGLAPNYFHRRFKRLFGQTPRDHMLAQRMNRARHLLTNTSKTIKEIAAHSGYEDPAHFSRVFAAQFGCPASLYRSQHC